MSQNEAKAAETGTGIIVRGSIHFRITYQVQQKQQKLKGVTPVGDEYVKIKVVHFW